MIPPHTYVMEGRKCGGVTTVLNPVLAKPWLIEWAVGCAVRSLEPLVGQTLTVDHLQAARKAHAGIRDAATDIGSVVHDLIRDAYLGLVSPERLASLNPQVATVYAGWLEWATAQSFEPLGVELMVGNPPLGYAGRIDMLARQNGELVLVDWKTSSKISKSDLLQLAGYARCVEVTYDMHVNRLSLVNIDKETGEVKNVIEASGCQLASCYAAWDGALSLSSWLKANAR